MQGPVQGAYWHSSGSAEPSAYVVTRPLRPLPGRDPTDFGFVPDPRVFSVDVAGEVENVPAHLLSGYVTDEPGPPITDADA